MNRLAVFSWVLLIVSCWIVACADDDDDFTDDDAPIDDDAATDDDQASDDDSSDDDLQPDDDSATDDDIGDDDSSPPDGTIFIAAAKFLNSNPENAKIMIYSAPTGEKSDNKAVYNFSRPSIAFCPGREPVVEPEVFANSANSPKLVCDETGFRHIAYCDQSDNSIVYAEDSTGDWVRTVVATPNNYTVCTGFGFALDADGKAHFLYGDMTNGYYVTNASGQWEESLLAEAFQNGYQLIAADDGLHATCRECINLSESCELKYLHLVGDEWSEKSILSYEPGGGFYYTSLRNSTLGVRDGIADVIYLHGWYMSTPDLTCSTTTHEVSGSMAVPMAISEFNAGDAQLIMSSSGIDYLAFIDDNCMDDYSWDGGSGPIQLAVRAKDGWVAETVDEAECDSPDLFVDSADNIHFAYKIRISQYEDQLIYATKVAGEWQATVIDQ